MAGEKAFPPATPERPSAPPTEPPIPLADLAAIPSETEPVAARLGFRDWPYWLQALVWAVAGAVVAASLTSAFGTDLAAERAPTSRVVYQCADGETRDTPCPRPTTTRAPATDPAPTAPPTTPPPPAAAPQPSGPATTIPPGIYAVGEDIVPGRYRSAGGSFCYWATLRGRSGEFDEIIANDVSDGGAQIVEIGEEVAYFETNGCETWVRD